MLTEENYKYLWLDSDDTSFWYSGSWWAFIGAAMWTWDITWDGHCYTKKELREMKVRNGIKR